jgi:hypothetical protein
VLQLGRELRDCSTTASGAASRASIPIAVVSGITHPASLDAPDLRASGITWEALAGTDPLEIQLRAGHERFETTQE